MQWRRRRAAGAARRRSSPSSPVGLVEEQVGSCGGRCRTTAWTCPRAAHGLRAQRRPPGGVCGLLGAGSSARAVCPAAAAASPAAQVRRACSSRSRATAPQPAPARSPTRRSRGGLRRHRRLAQAHPRPARPCRRSRPRGARSERRPRTPRPARGGPPAAPPLVASCQITPRISGWAKPTRPFRTRSEATGLRLVEHRDVGRHYGRGRGEDVDPALPLGRGKHQDPPGRFAEHRHAPGDDAAHLRAGRQG